MQRLHAGQVGERLHAEVLEEFVGGAVEDRPAERLAVLEGGKPAPFRVLSSGPGDARKVAFLCRDPGKVTFVASGEKPADGGKGAWMERKGLLLTTCPLPPEPRAENLADMRQTLARCGQDRPYGCGFVPNVYHGHNVFGPSDAYVSRYEGMTPTQFRII